MIRINHNIFIWVLLKVFVGSNVPCIVNKVVIIKEKCRKKNNKSKNLCWHLLLLCTLKNTLNVLPFLLTGHYRGLFLFTFSGFPAWGCDPGIFGRGPLTPCSDPR